MIPSSLRALIVVLATLVCTQQIYAQADFYVCEKCGGQLLRAGGRRCTCGQDRNKECERARTAVLDYMNSVGVERLVGHTRADVSQLSCVRVRALAEAFCDFKSDALLRFEDWIRAERAKKKAAHEAEESKRNGGNSDTSPNSADPVETFDARTKLALQKFVSSERDGARLEAANRVSDLLKSRMSDVTAQATIEEISDILGLSLPSGSENAEVAEAAYASFVAPWMSPAAEMIRTKLLDDIVAVLRRPQEAREQLGSSRQRQAAELAAYRSARTISPEIEASRRGGGTWNWSPNRWSKRQYLQSNSPGYREGPSAPPAPPQMNGADAMLAALANTPRDGWTVEFHLTCSMSDGRRLSYDWRGKPNSRPSKWIDDKRSVELALSYDELRGACLLRSDSRLREKLLLEWYEAVNERLAAEFPISASGGTEPKK